MRRVMGGSKRLIKDPERYKTVICVNWANRGECPYGRKCQFAHSKEELRCRPSLQQSPPQPPTIGGTAPPPLNMPTAAWPRPSSQQQHQPLPGMPPLPPGPGPLQTASVNLGVSVGASSNGSAMGLPSQMPQNIPGAILPMPGSLGSSPLASATLPGVTLPGATLPSATLPSASLPGATLPGMGGADGSTLGQQLLSLPAANTTCLPCASPPSAAPPLPSACIGPIGTHLAPAAAPSLPSTWSAAAATPQLANAPASAAGDELAKFAMQCHLGDWRSDAPNDIELRCHEITGRVEARCIVPPRAEQPSLTVGVAKESGFGIRGLNSDGQLDSPLEPGVSKREMSFSTQMVRRAVSFILNDNTFENDLSLENTRAREITKSPQTAIAA